MSPVSVIALVLPPTLATGTDHRIDAVEIGPGETKSLIQVDEAKDVPGSQQAAVASDLPDGKRFSAYICMYV